MTPRRRRTALATTILVLLPLALAGCVPFGRPTPTPLPAVTYPHTVVAVAPVELVVDRVAGAWQFTVRCREAGNFAAVAVVARGPSSEASYRSDLLTPRTCPSAKPPALTGGIVIEDLRADQRLTLSLIVTVPSSGGVSSTSGERTYIADGRGELRPATP
jgi:hypothetical protein